MTGIEHVLTLTGHCSKDITYRVYWNRYDKVDWRRQERCWECTDLHLVTGVSAEGNGFA